MSQRFGARSKWAICGVSLIWLCALAGPVRSAEPVAVALDLRGINEAAWWKIDGVTLESRAVTRLLQEGFAVVPPEASAPIRIVARVERQALVLELAGGKAEGRRVVGLGSASPELHLEVSQKIVDLARSARRASQAETRGAMPPAEASRAATPLELAAPVATPEGPAASPSPWGVAVIASALYRPGGLDALGQAELYRRTGPTLLAVALGGGAMNASGIAIAEGQLQVGARRALLGGARWETSAGLMVGPLLHRFSVTGASKEPQGTRVDLLATAPLTVELRAWGPLRLGGRVAPGWATRGRRHLQRDQELWRRDAFRLETGIVLSLLR